MELRNNLLVTIGSRAAYMHADGIIVLPDGLEGEDTLASFAEKTVAAWMAGSHEDMSFDEYIEGKLLTAFPGGSSNKQKFFVVVFSSYEGETDARVFLSKSNAEASIQEEMKAELANICEAGYKPVVLHQDGSTHTEIYVADSGIYYEWDIIETNT